MEQLNIFDLFEATEYLLTPQTGFIDINDVFKLKQGTLVYIGEYYSLQYEILEDDGHTARIKYVTGYKGKKPDEMTIPSLEIKAIVGPELIPLPVINRPSNIDLEHYKTLENNFFDGLSESEKMDMMTYLIILSPFNTAPDKFFQYIKEDNWESAEKQIQYGTSYIRPIGMSKRMSFNYFPSGEVRVIYSADHIEYYSAAELVKNYRDMQKRLNEKLISELNVFELLTLYRQKGYLLTYRCETDEWFIQHAYSEQHMPIRNGREALNNVMEIVKKYENKVCTANYEVPIYNTELELFAEKNPTSNDEDLTGFMIPKDTIVSTATEGYLKLFKVISDNGREAVLKPVDGKGVEVASDDLDSIAVESTDISYVFPFIETGLRSIKVPTFNRPKTLTLDILMERRENFYQEITEKELLDLSVIRASRGSYETSKEKFHRAMMEGNENGARKLLEGHIGGSHSEDFSVSYSGSNYELKYGVNKTRILNLKTTAITNHYKKMMTNVNSFPTHKLSLGELILAYKMVEYSLNYDHITDEYTLTPNHSHSPIKILKGRATLNNIVDTIYACNSTIYKK